MRSNLTRCIKKSGTPCPARPPSIWGLGESPGGFSLDEMALLEGHPMAAFPGHKFCVSVSTALPAGAAAPRAATHQAGAVKVGKGKGRSGKLFLASWQRLEEMSKQVAATGHFVSLPALQGGPLEHWPCPIHGRVDASLHSLPCSELSVTPVRPRRLNEHAGRAELPAGPWSLLHPRCECHLSGAENRNV